MTASVSSLTTARIEVVDEVASVLRERIFAGHYRPGDSLRQERLASELQIGRTPTREALRQLEQEGLLQGDTGRGVRVVTGDAARLVAVYEVRSVLDGLAARLSSGRGDRRDWLPHLDRTLAAQRRALGGDPLGYAQAAADFHVALVHMSDNAFLVAQTSLVRLSLQVLVASETHDPLEERRAVHERTAVRDAVAAGDPELAESTARGHVERRLAHLRTVSGTTGRR